MISIDGLQALADALARLDLPAAQREGLESAAQQLESAVKQSLSRTPGDDHSTPWLRTGTLRDSIAHSADETGAAIGSDDPVAVYQELGTRTVPPRPFLAPSAAAQSEGIGPSVAAAVVRILRGAVQ
jgi:phage gpG-like protein